MISVSRHRALFGVLGGVCCCLLIVVGFGAYGPSYLLPSHDLDKHVYVADMLARTDWNDAGFELEAPGGFYFGECYVGIRKRQDGEGCVATYYEDVPSDGGGVVGDRRQSVLGCGQSVWICSRPYRCPCPYDARQIDMGPDGTRGATSLLRSFLEYIRR